MAVTMAPISNHLYQGLSGDTKPTNTIVPVNAIFYETDTGNFFIYTGSAWVASDGAPPMRYW